MILLTGLTGRIGAAAAHQLTDAGVKDIRAIVRNPDSDIPQSLQSVECITADLADTASLASAMQGISRALLVAPNGEQQFNLERNFIDAASAAGVEHVVKISSMEAGPAAKAPIPQLHYQSEQYLRQSGLAWTMLQPNFFMQNFMMYAQSIKTQHLFALPFANAKVAPVDCADVGAVVAAVLTDEQHRGKTYKLTAQSLLDMQDVADIFTDVCGESVRYIDMEPAQFRAFMHKIVPHAWHADAVSDLFDEIRSGSLEETTTHMHDILGREPNALRPYVERHRSVFCDT